MIFIELYSNFDLVGFSHFPAGCVRAEVVIPEMLWGVRIWLQPDNSIVLIHMNFLNDQRYLTAIRTYFTRWLIRTNSYNLTRTI